MVSWSCSATCRHDRLLGPGIKNRVLFPEASASDTALWSPHAYRGTEVSTVKGQGTFCCTLVVQQDRDPEGWGGRWTHRDSGQLPHCYGTVHVLQQPSVAPTSGTSC